MGDCPGNYNLYCHICGKFTIPASRLFFSGTCAKRYEQYFGMSVIRNVKWAPSIVCRTCYNQLSEWENGTRIQLPFGIPMIWCDPGSPHNAANCYVCANPASKRNRLNRAAMIYKEVPSAQLPIPHSDNVPVPKRPSPEGIASSSGLDQFADQLSNDPTYILSGGDVQCNHIEITQLRMDTIIRRLKLSKRNALYLVGHLKAVNILAPDVKVVDYRDRSAQFFPFFTANDENTIAYCNNVPGIMATMNIDYNPDLWRLFIDASKTTLKAVLLYVDNTKNPVPIAMSTNTKETYASLKSILDLVRYNDHQWRICTDLKVTALLAGLQMGYVKNMCFLCTWDAHYKQNHYTKRDWKLRDEFTLNYHNVVNVPLVPTEKILLPPLHIKLGIVKNFIKCLAKNESPAFLYLKVLFNHLSIGKLKEGRKFKRNYN